MKKISVLLMSFFGVTALVACNSGSSSSPSNTGGDPTTIPAPEQYKASLPAGGELISTTNLYLSTNSSEIPLQFGVKDITTDVIVKFTVETNSNINSNSLKGGSSALVPTISPRECVFKSINPQPCTITVNASVAPVGNYRVVPSTAKDLAPIMITTMTQSSFTLPNGAYTTSEYIVSGISCQITEASGSLAVSNGEICFNYDGHIGCQNNHPIPIPSGSNPFDGRGFFSNVVWTGSAATMYWIPEGCPGVLAPITITKSLNHNVLNASPVYLSGGRAAFSTGH